MAESIKNWSEVEILKYCRQKCDSGICVTAKLDELQTYSCYDKYDLDYIVGIAGVYIYYAAMIAGVFLCVGFVLWGLRLLLCGKRK